MREPTTFLPFAVLIAATFLSIAACYYVTIEGGLVPVVERELRD